MRLLPSMRSTILLIGLFSFNTGCGSLVGSAVAPILENVNDAVYTHTDLELVKAGIPGNLLMVEGLVRTAPNNREVLVKACQAFVTMGFLLEDEDPERASDFYSRGKEYGVRALRTHRKFRKALDKGEKFENAIKKVDKESYLPALLWTGVAWGQYTILNISDPAAGIHGPKIRALMDQVVSIDTNYFHGLPHAVIASFYNFMPSLFIGGPKAMDAEFKVAIKVDDGKFLLAKFLYARYYATQILDEKLFDRTLKEVTEPSFDTPPELKLMNALAKKKAETLLERKDEFF